MCAGNTICGRGNFIVCATEVRMTANCPLTPTTAAECKIHYEQPTVPWE